MRGLLALLALLVACDSIQIYRVDGRVVSVDDEGRRIEIAHQDIDGFMPAMVMHFDVAEPALLEGVEPGVGVRFDLERRGARLRILKLEVTDTSRAGIGGGADFVSSPAPGFELVDQDGRATRLQDLRGKALLVDFIFTRCPGPCPIQTALHASLQRSLPPGVKERTHFISITLDPDFDGPEQLKAYADRHGADLSSWSFLSGDRDTVRSVAQAYYVAPSGTGVERSEGPLDHIMARYLIAPEGHIARRYVGPDVSQEQLLQDLSEIAGS
jgi:protein SCO1/2